VAHRTSSTVVEADGKKKTIVMNGAGQAIFSSTTMYRNDGTSIETITSHEDGVIRRVTNPDGSVEITQVEYGTRAINAALESTASFFNLVHAIQTGQPLPIVVSGINALNHLTPSSTLSAASAYANSVASMIGLANSIEDGDALGIISNGAGLLSYSASAFAREGGILAGTVIGDVGKQLNAPIFGNAVPGVNAIAVINIGVSLAQGNYLGAAIGVASMIPGVGPFIGAAYAIYSVLSGILGDDPRPWGTGRFV
jgi:hypothetical protein